MENLKQNSVIKSQRPLISIKRKKTLRAKIIKRLADIFNFFYRDGMIYNALDSKQSLELLIKTRKSLIRLGNGESEIIAGFDMGTQRYHPELRKQLIKILKDYSLESSYLLALPNSNLTVNIKTLQERKNYKIWRYMRYFLWLYKIHKVNKMPFLEANMFRIGEEGLPDYEIEKLWIPYEHIIIVHNSQEYFEWFRNKYPLKTISFIKIPDRDFFFVLKDKQYEILKVFQKFNISKENSVILVSAGPGGKVLCYNLSKLSFLCYDMGNFFHMRYQLERKE